jgi:hypothetical protein
VPFCRFEIPKAARTTVKIATIPEFCFMMKPSGHASAISDRQLSDQSPCPAVASWDHSFAITSDLTKTGS